jgi:threonine synthase
MFLTELVCGLCGKLHSKDEVQSVCQDCGRPLLAQYDLLAASAALKKEQLAGLESSLWRYRELLPLATEAQPVTHGEGWTPLLPAPRLGQQFGLERLWIKDESQRSTSTRRPKQLVSEFQNRSEISSSWTPFAIRRQSPSRSATRR